MDKTHFVFSTGAPLPAYWGHSGGARVEVRVPGGGSTTVDVYVRGSDVWVDLRDLGTLLMNRINGAETAKGSVEDDGASSEDE